MADLSEALLASKNLTEAYDAIMNAVGAKAWKHLEDMQIAQDVRERRAVERDMAPWTLFDVELLKRLVKPAEGLAQQSDPLKPGQRLAGIVEQMEDVRKRAERGW